jgi:hypothetical protein
MSPIKGWFVEGIILLRLGVLQSTVLQYLYKYSVLRSTGVRTLQNGVSYLTTVLISSQSIGRFVRAPA